MLWKGVRETVVKCILSDLSVGWFSSEPNEISLLSLVVVVRKASSLVSFINFLSLFLIL